MPTILDADGNETLVSDQVFEKLRREVHSDQRDQVTFAAHEQDRNTKFWDFIDCDWTRALPRQEIEDQRTRTKYQSYLDKVVIKCSACRFTTLFDNGVNDHINIIEAQAMEHRGAVIRETDNGSRLCSGCGCTFHSRPGKAPRHLAQILELSVVHQGKVEALHMRRYGLAPSEPIILSREVVREGSEASQMGRDTSKKRRRRRKGNGNSGQNGTAPLG